MSMWESRKVEGREQTEHGPSEPVSKAEKDVKWLHAQVINSPVSLTTYYEKKITKTETKQNNKRNKTLHPSVLVVVVTVSPDTHFDSCFFAAHSALFASLLFEK